MDKYKLCGEGGQDPAQVAEAVELLGTQESQKAEMHNVKWVRLEQC